MSRAASTKCVADVYITGCKIIKISWRYEEALNSIMYLDNKLIIHLRTEEYTVVLQTS